MTEDAMVKVEWTDWSDAVPVDKRERDRWVQKAVAKVLRSAKDGDERGFYNISSGDTLVIAFHWGDEVTVCDCVIRREGRVSP